MVLNDVIYQLSNVSSSTHLICLLNMREILLEKIKMAALHVVSDCPGPCSQ